MPTWQNILDQPDAVTKLRQAYRADRLPHGLLFAGPVGVGKGTTAAALATVFLCEHPKSDEPCGTCESCVAMKAGSHPDYHVVYKEMIREYDETGKSVGKELSVKVIRPEVLNKAAAKPVAGVGKVFVIEQAEVMNAAAQNSLLKTLEEPPGRTLIVLLTDQPEVLLPTIRSRTRTISFGPLPAATVVTECVRRGKDKPAAIQAAKLTGGSLGLSLKWIDDGVIDRANELTTRLDSILTGGPVGDLPEWFKSASDEYAAKQEQRDPLSSKSQAARDGLGLYLKLSADHARRSLMSSDDPDRLERLCQVIDAVFRAEQFVDANVNVGLVFQQLAGAIEAAV